MHRLAPAPARTWRSRRSAAQFSDGGYWSSGRVNRNSGHVARGGRFSRVKVSTCADRETCVKCPSTYYLHAADRPASERQSRRARAGPWFLPRDRRRRHGLDRRPDRVGQDRQGPRARRRRGPIRPRHSQRRDRVAGSGLRAGGHGQAHVLRHRPEAVPEEPERHRDSLPRGVRPSLSGVDADRGQLPFRPGCADRDRRGRGAPDMKRWEHFDYDESEGVATLTFSRPERLNALTFEVYADIRELTESLRIRQDIRVMVIRGRGRGFCSGGDVDAIIGELVKRGTRDVFEFARMTGACVRNLREMPQPVIASVNGIGAGAGAVLATASDIRVLAESATFRFLFTSVGLSGGDMGICWLLPRIIGLGRATEALLLGDKITSQQALAWGLAARVVPDDRLDAAVDEYVAALKDLAPWGLAMTKEMLNRAASSDYSSAIEMEAFTQTLLMTAEAFREFHAGFTGKRKPEFRGR